MNIEKLSKDYFDIIITGAGPAGCTLAKSLINTNNSLKILLIEQKNFPRDKICGDIIAHSALPTLKEIFHSSDFSAYHDNFTQKFTIWYSNTTSVTFNNEGLTVIPRLELDHIMFKSLQHPSITILENTSVIDILKNNKTICGVKVHHKNKNFCLHASLVCAADGASSVVRKKTVGIHKSIVPSIRQYVKNIPVPTRDGLVFLLDKKYGGYFWIFPFKKNDTWWANIGYFAFNTYQQNVKMRFKRYLNHSIVKAYLKNGTQQEKAGGAPISLSNPHFSRISFSQPLGGDGYLLLGDAAGLAHPYTGEGISMALFSGKIAAELINAGLTNQVLAKIYTKQIKDCMNKIYALKETSSLFYLPCKLPTWLQKMHINYIRHKSKTSTRVFQ